MVDQALHRRIERERNAADPNAADLKVYRRYAEGNQDGTLNHEQRQRLGSAAKHPYADNVADMILAAWASRLTLTGFAVESEPVQALLDDLYVRNGLGDLSYDVNYAAGRDGNHALMLRWLPDDAASTPAEPDAETGDVPADRRPGRVTVHAEDWWDGDQGVWVAYDDQGRPAYAVKDFVVAVVDHQGNARERKRRTVYYPDRIERYVQNGQGWEPYQLPADPSWPLPWTKRDGTALGLPVVHFSFPRFGKRRYGVSEMAGGFLANQDHINELQQDLLAAARLLGFMILTGTGVAFDGTPKVAPGSMLHTTAPEARFGSIPPGDLKQIIDAYGIKLQTIAHTTATPIHIITGGDWPAGVALVQAEKPLIAKVRRLAKVIGPAWATVAHRATEMANAFGGAGLDENALITTRFGDPEQLDQLAQAQVELTKAQAAQARLNLGTDRTALREIGFTDQEIETIVTERTQAAATAADSFTRAFNAGRLG